MANGKPGRKKTYGSAKALRDGIESYWRSISYERQAVVMVPTDDIDERGNVRHVAVALTVDEQGNIRMDGWGKPKTSVCYLKEPSVAGLCLHLGISKQTWSTYKSDPTLGKECERFLLRLEEYVAGKLDGNSVKNVQGAIFNLKNNFGWRENPQPAEKESERDKVQVIIDVEPPTE